MGIRASEMQRVQLKKGRKNMECDERFDYLAVGVEKNASWRLPRLSHDWIRMRQERLESPNLSKICNNAI